MTTQAHLGRSGRPALALPGWGIDALAVIILIAAVVGGLFLGRATKTEIKPLGLADVATVEFIDRNIAGVNGTDAAAFGATYASDAVVTDLIKGEESKGRAQIVSNYIGAGLGVRRVSEVTMSKNFLSFAFTYNGGSGIAVFELSDGVIAHQWLMGR